MAVFRARRPPDPAREELRRYYQGAPIGKPEPSAVAKAREDRKESEREARVRVYVFARERDICRVTRFLPAESRHELRFRSLGGKVTRENCVAIQGDGVRGIHGLLQRNEISYEFEVPGIGAEGTIFFTAKTAAAADAMRVRVGETIASEPFHAIERAL